MPGSVVLRELRELETVLHQPEARGSHEVLERLLHANFIEVGRSGRRYTRPETITHLLAEPSAEPVEAENFQALELSPSVALLTYRSGGLRRPTLRVSVWIRETDGWQLVYHQGTAETKTVSGTPSDDDLRATVERMSASLGASQEPEVQQLMSKMLALHKRFEYDLVGSSREVDIAKSAALMVVQMVARTTSEA